MTKIDDNITQLATALGEILHARGLVLATAESCTGGGIGEAVTRVPGSSAWFDCAFVTYSYEAKTAMLGVNRATLVDQGAVSDETVREMVAGAIERSRAQVAVAVTGIAGPGGGIPGRAGEEGKPVGTVWFAWKLPKKAMFSEVCHFKGDRQSIRQQTVAHALKQLLDNLGPA